MALTANVIPTQVTTFPCPVDDATVFASPAAPQTLTATGYVNSFQQQLDLGGSKPLPAAGRTDMIWSANITAINMASGNEFYQFGLLGSNDVSFGNGNVELLNFYDLAAAAANRVFANILGATPTIPPTGFSGMRIQAPLSNLQCLINYRYARLYCAMGGTAPSVTLSSWLSRAGIHV